VKSYLKDLSDFWNVSRKENITLRDLAFIIAIKKNAKDVELRYIFTLI